MLHHNPLRCNACNQTKISWPSCVLARHSLRLPMVFLVGKPPPSLLALRGGLDAKWTANGESPAPYSTNARQQMGMDPQQMAGQMPGMPGQQQAPPQAPGAMLQFNLLALLVIYLANNWKIVLYLQDMVMTILQPFIGAREARAAEAARAQREAGRLLQRCPEQHAFSCRASMSSSAQLLLYFSP